MTAMHIQEVAIPTVRAMETVFFQLGLHVLNSFNYLNLYDTQEITCICEIDLFSQRK